MKTSKLALVLTGGLITATAIAAEPPKEGKYDVHSVCSGPAYTLAGVKDHMGGVYTATCTPDAAEGTLYHGIVAQCFGAWSLVSGAYEESGSCEMTDHAGDKFFGVYSKKGQADGTWKVTGGTGKYQGMQSGGPWNVINQKPALPGQSAGVFRWWGTYRMQ